jgi:hypothetical protein
MRELVDGVPRSRRAILAGALAAAAGALAQAIALPGRVLAAAPDDGQPITIGKLHDLSVLTTLQNTSNNLAMLKVVHAGAGTPVWAKTASGTGLLAESTDGYAISAGSTENTGVFAGSQHGEGLIAESHATARAAVVASGQGGSTAMLAHAGGAGTAPQPRANTGVMGTAIGTGTGGYFTSETGHAIRVAGKASFSRAGRASVPANRSYVDITVPGGIVAESAVIATLQAQRGTACVTSVRLNYPSAGKARIYLNKVASTTASTPVAWFVIG